MTRMPQGHCTLPADDAGRVLDRLGGTGTSYAPRTFNNRDGHWPDLFAKLSADSRGRSVGGTGDGVVDRFADPTGLQTRPAVAQGRGVAPSLQPLRRPSAVGRGTGAASVHPSRSTLGPAGGRRGRSTTTCGRWGSTARSSMSPTRRPTQPFSPAPRQGLAGGAPPSSPQAQSRRVGDACRSRPGGAILGRWRAIDDRRRVPPSDVGDAPALGPGILQLRSGSR